MNDAFVLATAIEGALDTYMASPHLLDVTSANVDQIIARQASTSTREAWFTPEIDRILHHLNDYLRSLS